MNIDGINNIAITIGYKYFIFLFDSITTNIPKTIVDTHIKNTIPIVLCFCRFVNGKRQEFVHDQKKMLKLILVAQKVCLGFSIRC